MRITIDDAPVFEMKNFGDLTDVPQTIIPVNKTINQNSKVKIFLISDDGSIIALTTQVTFEDK